MITFKQKGNFSKANRFFEKALESVHLGELDKYGKKGVEALSAATPSDTGNTAASWTYEIRRSNGAVSLLWNNTNINKGVNIAIILQYGHGTGTGGYVQGRDYINPAIQPIFDEMAESLWKEITK